MAVREVTDPMPGLETYYNAGAPTSGVDAVHTIVESGSPTGGTWTFTDARAGGKTSSALAYNATAATVQAAADIVYLAGNTVVTRSGTTTNFTWVFTYAGNLASTAVTVLTADATLLTGGTPVLTVTDTTTGVAGTYAKLAPKGARLMDTTNAKLYVQTGTATTPAWTVAGSQS